VALEKPAVYRLGAGALPCPTDIERAVRVMAAACVVAVVAMAAAYGVVASLV
jgi:cobalamin biosynthesis protein CobD/CbiB